MVCFVFYQLLSFVYILIFISSGAATLPASTSFAGSVWVTGATMATTPAIATRKRRPVRQRMLRSGLERSSSGTSSTATAT